MHLIPKLRWRGCRRRLAKDGNQEIWVYQLPAVTDVDLSTGANLPLQDLEPLETFFK